MNIKQMLRSRSAWVAGGLTALLILALYLPSISLPLSFDDAWGMRLVRDFSWLDLFTRTQNFGYYRPLYLLYYKLGSLFGAQAALVQHIAGLLFHLANALLLGHLVRVVLGHDKRALSITAGVLFAINPLSVQAVALPAGLNHLSALLFMQLALLQYIALRRGAQPRAWRIGLFLALALLAFFSNEVALSLAGFCLAYEVASLRWSSTTRSHPLPLPQGGEFAARRAAILSVIAVAGLSAAYAILYLLIPKGDAPEFVFTLGDALHRSLFALQHLAYPLAFVIRALAGDAIAPALQVLIAAGALLGSCAWAARKPALRAAVVLGLLMFAAGAALSVLRLPTGYIENAPRVFYVASAGIAITLAALLMMRNAFSAVLAVCIALSTFFHTRDQLRLLDMAHEPVRALASAAQAAPAARILALNMPEWAAYARKQFPLGQEGAIVLAPYVDARDLITANTGLSATARLAQIDTAFQPTPLLFGAFGEKLAGDALAGALAQADVVLLTANDGERLNTRWLGGVSTPTQNEVMATFAGALEMRDVAVTLCDDGYLIQSRWRAVAGAPPISPTLSMFAQILDADGNKLGQADGGPLGGLANFTQVRSDADLIDRRRLSAPATQAGARLLLGVYDYTTGARLPAKDAGGNPLAGNALELALPIQAAQQCR